ncbi:MAG: DUF465 domain-containing protein [Pseudomonadota bacterium]
MSVTAHIEALRRKHADLSEIIDKEQRQPGSNDLELTALKREKLKLKEEISRLAAHA